MDPSKDDMLAQMRKGIVEFCVLAHLSRSPSYGQALAEAMSASEVFGSPGTLYPLLARLRKQGWVTTHLEESPIGPARKYYSLTAEGRRALDTFSHTWRDFSWAVNNELEGL